MTEDGFLTWETMPFAGWNQYGFSSNQFCTSATVNVPSHERAGAAGGGCNLHQQHKVHRAHTQCLQRTLTGTYRPQKPLLWLRDHSGRWHVRRSTSTQFLIVKNAWGTDFIEQGYIRIERGTRRSEAFVGYYSCAVHPHSASEYRRF
jgi:hypothetical protein